MMDDIKDRNSNGLGNDKDRDRDRGRDRRSSPSRRRRSRSPVSRRSDDRSGGHSGRDSRASRRVYVANVPFDVKWSDLKDLFRDKIGNVTYCQLFENEDNKSRGCGLVEFADSTAARKAIDVLHRYEYRGRELVVKEDLDCERDRCGRLILPSRRGDRDRGDREREYRSDAYDSSVGNSQSYNTYGLSPQFLESLGVKGPLNNRIFVANLDYKVGEHKLEEIFKLAGKVTNVKLYTDATGNSKGHGTVEFEHPVEAVQAISMFHNQKLFGRALSVRMDKYDNDEPPHEAIPSKLPPGLDGVGKGLGIGGQPLNIQKSMLSTSSNQPINAIQSQPPPVPAPNAALSALTNLAQLPSFAQSLSQLNQTPTVGTVGTNQVANNGLNIPGFVSTVDRSLSSLGPNAGSSLNNLNQNVNPGLNSNLNSFANTAQNVLASLSNVSSQPLSGINPLQMSNSHNPHNPHNPHTQHTGLNANNGNLSVYSTYEREFRDDRVRPQTTISDTIIVRNLPPTFSWQNLRDRFNEIGEVRFAEMKSHGQAIVRFRSDRDSQRAVDLMNGIRIDNRPIEVNIY
ncbi:myelin expression factor 2-like [Oppia nitens]|uniref:myelin expression factor 2-like n=1 Tax=Oppia nitens TaxID=1686743 RepID=UPI0023DACB7B|nr:myelin expression factor 2-like [Oppia nitens]